MEVLREFFFANWVDIAIIWFLFIYVVFRIKRGFIDSMVDLIGFVLSFFIALQLFQNAANLIRSYFEIPPGFANAIGFFTVVTLTELLFSFLAFFILKRIPRDIERSRINKVLGVIPSFVSALILTVFFLIAVVSLPVRPGIKQDVLSSKIGSTLTQNTFGLETNVNEVFGGAIKEALSFLTVKPQSDESISLDFTTTEFSADPQAEAEMLVLVNKERTSRGLNSLRPNEELRAVASKHCEDMFERGYFSHYTPEGLSPFDRMKAAGIEYLAAGENLAYAPSTDVAHEGLMNSPGHRANILSVDFNQVGIGVINAGVYGKMYCQVFSN